MLDKQVTLSKKDIITIKLHSEMKNIDTAQNCQNIFGVLRISKKYLIIFDIKWSKVTAAPTYQPSTRRCNLCSLEKSIILYSNDNILNKRNEIMNKCRHRNCFLLGAITQDKLEDLEEKFQKFSKAKIKNLLIYTHSTFEDKHASEEV